jgi:hypothetical protein
MWLRGKTSHSSIDDQTNGIDQQNGLSISQYQIGSKALQAFKGEYLQKNMVHGSSNV